jgi:hypothetical protein
VSTRIPETAHRHAARRRMVNNREAIHRALDHYYATA